MGMIGICEDESTSIETTIWKSRYEALYRYVKQNYASDYVDGAEYGQMGTMYGDFTSTSELD